MKPRTLSELARLTNRQWLLVILVVAAVSRLLMAIYLGNEISGLSGAFDEITYSTLGQRMAGGYGLSFPSDWYPWIPADTPQSYFSFAMGLGLGLVYAAAGFHPLIARLLMAGLSVAVVFMIYLVATRFFDRRVGLLSAAIASVYAYLIFYGATLVTETPFLLAILVALYCGLRLREGGRWGWWLVMGIALAAAVLLRMAIIFYVPLLLLWTVWPIRRNGTLWLAALPLVMIALTILPFTVRNYRVWGEFLPLQSQFGHVFWNGNHPGHEGNFHPFRVFPIPEEILASGNDAVMTSELLQLGIQNILNDPASFVSLTLTRLREFFKFWPTADSSTQANILRVVSFGVLVPFALAGLIINLGRWRELLPIYLLILVHTGMHAVTWTMIRYRIPLDAFFIMFGASAVVLLVQSLQSRRRRSPADQQLPAI